MTVDEWTTTKRCSRCRKDKPLVSFHEAAKALDGKHWWCIPCRREYRKQPARMAVDRARNDRRPRGKRH